MSRCYKDGIPDEVPAKLAAAGRAPSWKSIAMCLLKNDMHLRGIGFGRTDSSLVDDLYRKKREEENPQIRLFP